ncbi:MAG: helix-turn-helix domain-containing protein [Candidatus Dormibacteraeota bacterium]|nr:helix-turn-helix domain-containing protein [Candidatus Dormibacteraeota bacterium]
MDQRAVAIPSWTEASANDPRLPVEIDASPVYELLMSLLVFSLPDDAETFDAGPGWFMATRRQASPELLASAQELSAPAWLWLHLLGVAYKMPAPKRPPQFLAHLQQFDAELLAFHVFGCFTSARRVPPALVQQAQAGDGAARSRMARVLFPDDQDHQAALIRLIALPNVRLKALVIDLLDRWYREIFRQNEREVASVLAGEARAKRVVGKTSPQRLVRFVTRGIDYMAEPGIRRILLIPSVIVRPWVLMTTVGSTRVFCYPVEDEAPGEPDAPPSRLVRVHRALAHEDRLRILRALGREPMTADRLSRELGQPIARVRAHLVLLRAARLVDLQLSSSEVSSVRPNLVPTVYRMLRAYLPPPAVRSAGEAELNPNA